MGNRRTFTKSRRGRPGLQGIGLLLIGGGLVLFGVLSAVVLAGQAQAPQTGRPSVIPQPVSFDAPPLALDTLQGRPAALDEYAGRVVLVNNWATWCPPCREEMPALQAYYQQHQAEGFTIVAVNAGDAAGDVQEFVDRMGLTFEVWLDPAGEALRLFRNDSLPSSYVIDRQGVVRLAWTGGITQEILEEYITPLLEE
jgi:thiol-disulfide isomerase/thioredoxin